jgi:hypothetical protein
LTSGQTSTWSGAVQMCPELTSRPNAIRRAAVFTCADEWTMQGFLPPSSSTAGVRFFAAASEISEGFRTAVFPAAMAATRGASVSMYGSFHAPMIKVTPNGSRRTRTWPGSISTGVGSLTGFTQSCRCLSAYSASRMF